MNNLRSRSRMIVAISMATRARSGFVAGHTAQEWPAQWITARDVPLNPPKGAENSPAAIPD
jgi:hypothetical protein